VDSVIESRNLGLWVGERQFPESADGSLLFFFSITFLFSIAV
jgi:hypothetical protein